MRRHELLAISVLALATVAGWCCRSGDAPPRRTAVISTFLDLTRQEVEATYGRGSAEGCRCYFDGTTYAEFCEDEDDDRRRMWRVTFSRDAACLRPVRSRVALPVATTPHGARIGDAEELLFTREGPEYAVVTPDELRRRRHGPLTAEQLEQLGDVEYQFSSSPQPVLSVFVRNQRVTAIAAWLPDS